MKYRALDSLESVDFLSSKERKLFEAKEIKSVEALLNYHPRRYEDRRRFDTLPSAASDIAVCLSGVVADSARTQSRGYKRFSEILIEIQNTFFDQNTLKCRWFNMPYISCLLYTSPSPRDA